MSGPQLLCSGFSESIIPNTEESILALTDREVINFLVRRAKGKGNQTFANRSGERDVMPSLPIKLPVPTVRFSPNSVQRLPRANDELLECQRSEK